MYQAIYDATRSRLSNGDIGEAVQAALRDANLAHYASVVSEAYMRAAAEQERPSVLFRPKVHIDGNQWCALYGENLQDGVAGFGFSPEQAMHDFDRNWYAKLTPNVG